MRNRNLNVKLRSYLWFNRFLKLTLGVYLRLRFRLHGISTSVVRRIEPPYLLLPNHVGFWDPFFLSILVPQPVYFVAADANFRSRLLRRALSWVGAVPITKGVSDLETVRHLLSVRDAGGVIGLFGEGGRTWDGVTLPMASGTAKLAKLLKIPVVCPVFKGGYLSHPRWARSPRRGRIYIEFHRAIEGEELGKMTVAEIDTRIARHLAHDDVRWASEAGIRYRSGRPAEYVEHVLFACPACRRIGTLRSHIYHIACTACRLTAELDANGAITIDSAAATTDPAPNELSFTSVRQWHQWELELVSETVRCALFSGTELGAHSAATSGTELGAGTTAHPGRKSGAELLRDSGIVLRSGFRTERMKRRGTGTIVLTSEELRFEATGAGEQGDGAATAGHEGGDIAATGGSGDRDRAHGSTVLRLPVAALRGVNVQMQRTLELYAGESLYTFTPRSPRLSMYKWERFIYALQRAHAEGGSAGK